MFALTHMNNLKKTKSKNLKTWTRKVQLPVIPFILIDDLLYSQVVAYNFHGLCLQQQEKLGGE